MHNCKEIARAVSSDELSELPLGRRLLVRWHLFVCRDCARYSRQIEAIGRAMRGYALERDTNIALGLDLDCERETEGIADSDSDRLQMLEGAILDDLLGGAGKVNRASDSPGV